MAQSKVKVWCEWDVGLEHTIYASQEEARKDLREILPSHGVEEPLEELEGEGLVGYKPVEIVGEVRYRLVGDDSGHDYVVPVDKTDEWYQWMDSEAAELGDEPPEWARIIAGTFTFTNPES